MASLRRPDGRSPPILALPYDGHKENPGGPLSRQLRVARRIAGPGVQSLARPFARRGSARPPGAGPGSGAARAGRHRHRARPGRPATARGRLQPGRDAHPVVHHLCAHRRGPGGAAHAIHRAAQHRPARVGRRVDSGHHCARRQASHHFLRRVGVSGHRRRVSLGPESDRAHRPGDERVAARRRRAAGPGAVCRRSRGHRLSGRARRLCDGHGLPDRRAGRSSSIKRGASRPPWRACWPRSAWPAGCGPACGLSWQNWPPRLAPRARRWS